MTFPILNTSCHFRIVSLLKLAVCNFDHIVTESPISFFLVIMFAGLTSFAVFSYKCVILVTAVIFVSKKKLRFKDVFGKEKLV